MGIIGSLAGGTFGIGASIFGGISASKAMKKVKKNLQQQQRENQDWFDRKYNEDATQRADAQAILTRTEESMRNRNRQAAGAQAVTGGTDESVAAAKAANNQAMADAVTNIAVAAENRKDRIEDQYMQTKAGLNEQLNNLEQAKAQNIAHAVQGAAQVGADMSSTF